VPPATFAAACGLTHGRIERRILRLDPSPPSWWRPLRGLNGAAETAPIRQAWPPLRIACGTRADLHRAPSRSASGASTTRCVC